MFSICKESGCDLPVVGACLLVAVDVLRNVMRMSNARNVDRALRWNKVGTACCTVAEGAGLPPRLAPSPLLNRPLPQPYWLRWRRKLGWSRTRGPRTQLTPIARVGARCSLIPMRLMTCFICLVCLFLSACYVVRDLILLFVLCGRAYFVLVVKDRIKKLNDLNAAHIAYMRRLKEQARNRCRVCWLVDDEN